MVRLVALCTLLALVACCPPALQATPTAFRAVVLGSTPAGAILQLQRDANAPLLSVPTSAVALEDADGAPVELSAFQPGDSVYLTGTMSGSGIVATQIQRMAAP